jgi:hypothetical protein
MPPHQKAIRTKERLGRYGLLALIVALLAYTASQGVGEGWYRWMPGPMSRHRDAVAVAITKVVYGQWHGYASYRAVNHSLYDHGMSVQPEIAARVGSPSYFDVISTPRLVDAALRAATKLPQPAAEGWYYSQDEKGMAVLYIIAFYLFGVSSSSLYWLYIIIYSLSIILACVIFRHRIDLLFFFVMLICAHDFIAKMIPAMPRGDVSVIYGNRFLGMLASVPGVFLMFLLLDRSRFRLGVFLVAGWQILVLFLAINARTTTEWLPISVIGLWSGLLIAWAFRRRQPNNDSIRPYAWPVVMMILGLVACFTIEHLAEDPAFHDGREEGGHPFWENFITALHNNPMRTQRYGIPADISVNDDRITYFLFDQEIARRGEDRSKYTMTKPDWIYRSTSPDLTFHLAAYDAVLRSVFLRTAASDPLYALNSIFVQQPILAGKLMLSSHILRSGLWFDGIPALAFAVGLAIAALTGGLPGRRHCLVLLAVTIGAMIPVMASAVVDLRLVELFYICLLDAMAIAAIFLKLLIDKFALRRELLPPGTT